MYIIWSSDTEILALMAVNDAIKSFKQRNFHFFATHVKYTIRRQLNIQVQKKNLFDAELATLDEEGCTSLDALASECYKESISRDERSACLLELVARLPQMQRLVISEVFLRGKSQREVAATLGVTSQSVYCSKKAALDTLRRALAVRQEGLR